MLLNQTSGVGNDQRRLERDTEARPRVVWSPRKTLSYARHKPHGVPGEKWEYNNANYVLAGLVIEHASGRTVAEALRELILDPLKLHDAVLQPQERPRSAPAHAHGGSPRIARALRIGGHYAPYPSEASYLWTAGGMVASAPSVARFADALLRGELLSPDWRRQLLRFVPATDGYESYGLGVGYAETSTGEKRGATPAVALASRRASGTYPRRRSPWHCSRAARPPPARSPSVRGGGARARLDRPALFLEQALRSVAPAAMSPRRGPRYATIPRTRT
jgi:CubicO group peptidase (beta-lactamase class C family)